MWEMIRGYLTFTRKERFGVLFLLILICILFILPYFLRPSVGQPDPDAYEKMKEEILNFELRENDSSRKMAVHNRYQKYKNDTTDEYGGGAKQSLHTELFYFDPNSLNANGWHRLGLPNHLIQTIFHFVEKGGHFRKAEDLKKLYGLRNSDYERLFPYVRIKKTLEDFRNRPESNDKPSFNIPAGKKFTITDINLADSADWLLLPGIGEKLASRIIHFREKLGGFYQIDQVGETFGLPDSSFLKIKPFLRLNTFILNQVDLNTATKEILQSHPYIRWQLSKAILEYRVQHGGFHSVEELLQLALMDSAKFEKLKPYLVAGGN